MRGRQGQHRPGGSQLAAGFTQTRQRVKTMKFIILGLAAILAGTGYVSLCHLYPQPEAWWWLDFVHSRYILFGCLIAGWLLVRTGLRRKPRA